MRERESSGMVVRSVPYGLVVSVVNPRPHPDRLAVARLALREIITLADQAPGLTDEQQGSCCPGWRGAFAGLRQVANFLSD